MTPINVKGGKKSSACHNVGNLSLVTSHSKGRVQSDPSYYMMVENYVGKGKHDAHSVVREKSGDITHTVT